MIAFLAKIILTNLLFSLALFSSLIRYSSKSKSELLIYSLGLGPAITSLLIYFLLVLIPGQGDLFYFLVILAVFSSLALYNRKYWKEILKYSDKLKNRVRSFWKISFKKEQLQKAWTFQNNLIPVRLVCLLFVFTGFLTMLYSTVVTPIIGHDLLEYAIQSDIFYLSKSIDYSPHRFDPNSGFYYVGLHGFSFPLLSTWESIFDGVFTSTYSDLYFKSLTGYYTTLTMLLAFIWLRKVNSLLSIFSSFALISSYGFFVQAMSFHLDTYRIFMFSCAFIFTLYTIEKVGWFNLICMGVFTGLSAFTHSLGVFLAVFACFTLFVMLKNVTLLERFKYLVLVVLIILLFGGVHYVLDIVNGTGWIFKEIKFY